MTADYSHILSKFQKLKVSPDGKYWTALCPAHDDERPSLSLKVGHDGKLLAKCHSGCTWPAIVAAIGSEKWQWFPDWEEKEKRVLDRKWRRRMDQLSKQVAWYDYCGEDGKLLFQSVRYEPKRFSYRRPNPDLPGGWIWNLEGVERVLFHLPELLSQTAEPVIVVEGEKDVLTLESCGFVATTAPCGAGKWLPHYGQWLKGRRVVILPDNDEPGLAHAGHVAGNLLLCKASSIRIVQLPGLPAGGDVTDWINLESTLEVRRKALIGIIRSEPEWKSQQPKSLLAS